MGNEVLVRAVCLYWPLLVLLVLAVWLRPGYYVRVGLMLALCWNIAVLPIVSWVAVWSGWWEFRTEGPAVLGMPLELYLGWVAWWGGVLPLVGLAALKRGLAGYLLVLTAGAAGVDAVVMPRLGPVVGLAGDWWLGELLLLGAVLWPGLLVAWWTARRTFLAGRVLVQAGTFSVGLFLLVPCLEAGGWGWLGEGFAGRPVWMVAGFVCWVALFGCLGGAAAWEFAQRGGGTPVPFDPPVRLVTTGVYARIANPMQVAMTGLLLGWGVWFALWWMLVLAGLGVAYSEGLARWSEGVDHRERFGEGWTAYRETVRSWRWKWRRSEKN